MARRDHEQRLWELASHHEDREEVESVSADVLTAYREGRLSVDERESVEWALTHSAATRSRLIELSGIEAGAPSQKLRARLMPGRSRNWMSQRFWLAAAAILLLGIAVPLWFRSTVDTPLPATRALVAYDVRVEGLTGVRSFPDNETRSVIARALPSTVMSIAVEPQESAVKEVYFALYRDTGERLERVTEEECHAVDRGRGAIQFRAEARVLVPTVSGVHRVYVVVSSSERMPQVVDVGSDDPTAALERATSGRVYPTSIRMEAEGELQ